MQIFSKKCSLELGVQSLAGLQLPLELKNVLVMGVAAPLSYAQVLDI